MKRSAKCSARSSSFFQGKNSAFDYQLILEKIQDQWDEKPEFNWEKLNQLPQNQFIESLNKLFEKDESLFDHLAEVYFRLAENFPKDQLKNYHKALWLLEEAQKITDTFSISRANQINTIQQKINELI